MLTTRLRWPLGLAVIALAVSAIALVSAGLGSGEKDSAASAATTETLTFINLVPDEDSFRDPLPEGAKLRLGTLRFRHPSAVVELALSPDEKSIVTIGSEELIVWDTATGKQRWRASMREHGIRLPAASYGIHALAFAPDSASFCTPGARNEIIVWHVQSGRHETLPCKDVLPADSISRQQLGAVKAVSISPDGKKVAIGSPNGIVVRGGKERALLAVVNRPKAADDPISRMNTDRLWFGGDYSFGVFSPDGKIAAIVTSEAPKAIRLFALDTGQELQRIALRSTLVRLAFSPDGKRIVTTERDVAVRLYDSKSGTQIWSREIESAKNAESYTSAVAYSPDAKIVAACAPIGPDNSIYLLDAATGSIVGKLTGHTWKPWGLAFTSDSKILYSSGWDGVIRRWDVATCKQLASPGGPRATGVCAASPDGRTLAYADDLGAVHFVDAGNGATLHTIESSGAEHSQLKFSPDGGQLAAGGARGDKVEVVLYRATTGKLVRRWDWPKGRDPHSTVESLSFTPDGNRLAAAVFRQSAAYLWDATTGQTIARLPHREIYGLSFSPDGKTLATAGWDKMIRFWETGTGAMRKDVNVEKAPGSGDFRDLRMDGVCYAPAGGIMATAHLDGTVLVWDLNKMTPRWNFDAGGSFVYGSISFSPDGRWLATGASSGRVSVWDASSGHLASEVGTHQHHVYTLAFGRDNRTLLTGGEDGACYLWNLRLRGEGNGGIPAIRN